MERPFSLSHPKMLSDWHRLVPESQYWSPRLLHDIWKPKEIYITENGCAAAGDMPCSTTTRVRNVQAGDARWHAAAGQRREMRVACHTSAKTRDYVFTEYGKR